MKYLLLLICLKFVSINLFSQEIKKIHKKNFFINEVYYVLKDDKSLKHGKYLKYREISKGLNLPIEYGSYDRNKKTGIWLIFNESTYQNPLRIIAEYANGEKNGQWVYYYSPNNSGNYSIQTTGNIRLSNVNAPKGENAEFNITVDTLGIKTAAVGYFINNRKIGKWRYYFKNGPLAEEYDFSLNKEIYSCENNTIDFNFKEGLEYFDNILTETIIDKIMIKNYWDPLIFKFELLRHDNSISIKNLSNNSSNSVWNLIEKSILSMNWDWIDFDPKLENFSMTIDLELQNDQFKHSFHLDPQTPN